ncbi:MAG: YHS domain-containing (seleno)protein [Burkholderiales bacterium]
MNRNLASRLVVAAILTMLSACTTINVVSDGDDSNLMLRGNDPVAYHMLNKATRGDPRIRAQHDGATYRFINEEHRRQFLASPQRYVPAYGGFCASGAPYALKANIGADTFKIVEGRLYLFGGARSRRHWEMDQEKNIRLGDWYWENETRERPFRLQNWYRYVIRVPHYRTDAELEAEWQRRHGKKPWRQGASRLTVQPLPVNV